MDAQDQTKPTTPSSSSTDFALFAGHESHGVHICHRCGWPFPNPHPSSKHRRAHNRVCGTIEGYTNTNLTIQSSETVSISDDEHDSDEDKDKYKTPSPKIEKRNFKESGSSAGGVEVRSNKSEDDLFSDAVTEFSDSGISPDTSNLFDSPIDVRKVDGERKVFRTADFYPKDKTEENDVHIVRNLADTCGPKPSEHLVEDRDGSEEVRFSDIMDTDVGVVEGSENKIQGEEAAYVLSVPSDIPVLDHAEASIEDFKDHKTKYSKVPLIQDSVGNDDMENRSIVGSKTVQVKIEESEPSENIESSMESVVSKDTNDKFSAFVPTVIIAEAKVTETRSLEAGKTVPESTDNLSDGSTEIAVVEMASEEINRGKLESDRERVLEVVEEAEIEHGVSVLTEDLVAEKRIEVYTQESLKEPESGIEVEQKIVASVSDDSKDGGNGGISQRPLEKAEELHNASLVVSEARVNEADDKLMPSQDCGVDASVGSSSRNSLEGNWGSVSVLSTASIDAENAQSIGKSEIAADKSRLGKPDASFVELKAETKSDQKTSEINTVAVQTSQPPKSEASRAGWLPSEANETEGRKINEEAIAKVTNWSTGEPTTTTVKHPKTPNPKQLSNTIQKDEASQKSSEPVNQEPSPPKYIVEGKKGRKKGKGYWIPFVCCSSVNVS